MTYVLGGLGIAALGAGAYLWVSGVGDAKAIRETGCEPACPEDEVDSARYKIIGGNVGAAVGAASLGTALVLYLSRGYEPQGPVGVDAAATPNGGLVTLQGVF
jgi:hypothetical protein